MMNTSFRSTLIAATSAALLALAPAAFAAGQATDTTGPAAANSAGAGNADISGQHQTGGMQTAGNSSSDMGTTGKATGTTSGPAANSNAVPNTAVTKQQGNAGMQTAQTGSNGSSEMNSAGNASVGAGAPGIAAKPGTEAGTANGHKTSQP